MNILYIIIIAVGVAIAVLLFFYILLLSRLQDQEQKVVRLFVEKTAKIPAIIEVMRPFVFDIRAFDTITQLHSQAMIHRYDTLYDLLEHNARIQHEFGFLMKLSMQIPQLQKDKYFVYMREFVIQYEHDIKKHFTVINHHIMLWNRYVSIKNMT